MVITPHTPGAYRIRISVNGKLQDAVFHVDTEKREVRKYCKDADSKFTMTSWDCSLPDGESTQGATQKSAVVWEQIYGHLTAEAMDDNPPAETVKLINEINLAALSHLVMARTRRLTDDPD